MKEFEPIKLDKETTDGTVRNLDALYQLFPSCFTEAPDALGEVHRAVDWGKLRELLGEYVEDGEPEKYDFTWVGKRAAQRIGGDLVLAPECKEGASFILTIPINNQ